MKLKHNELTKQIIHVEEDKMTKIFLGLDYLGEIFIDLVVERKVVIHVTAHDRLLKKELKRLNSFLKHSDCTIGLLLNFGIQTEFKRIEIA